MNGIKKQEVEYTYDKNENLTKDLNKGITDIQYNSLNLPKKVSFKTGHSIEYVYSSSGQKLSVIHKGSYIERNRLFGKYHLREWYIEADTGRWWIH